MRFKEFFGPWKKTILGKVSIDEMYGMNSAAKDFDGVNKYIRITDISDISHKFVPNPLTSPEGQLNDKFRLKEGDIVFARTGASTGKSYLYDKNDGKLYFAGFLIKFHINKACPQFVFFNTLRNNYENWVKVVSVRSGQPGINAEEYKKFMFYLPSIQEQEKIANFLSLIDKKIEFLEKTLVLYQKIKKYFVENIFKQNLRFYGFQDEWKTNNLNSLSIVKDGTHDSPKYVLNGYPLITSKNLINGKLDISDVNLISEEDFININKRSKVDVGDILFGMIGTIGNPVICDKSDFAIKNVALIKEKHNLKNKFLIYLLDSDFIKKQFYKCNAGGTQKFIALNLIRNLNILYPSLDEQEKIIGFFNLLDKKIDLKIKSINNLKNYKKSLLQKMFV